MVDATLSADDSAMGRLTPEDVRCSDLRERLSTYLFIVCAFIAWVFVQSECLGHIQILKANVQPLSFEYTYRPRRMSVFVMCHYTTGILRSSLYVMEYILTARLPLVVCFLLYVHRRQCHEIKLLDAYLLIITASIWIPLVKSYVA